MKRFTAGSDSKLIKFKKARHYLNHSLTIPTISDSPFIAFNLKELNPERKPICCSTDYYVLLQ